MTRLLLGTLAALLIVLPQTASAVPQTIPGGASNMTIYVGDDGRMQAVLPNQPSGMFFGNSAGPAASYFYLRIKSGPQANTTYSSQSGFTPISNGPVTGNFTPSSPAQVETVFDTGPTGAPLLRVKQTTLYVAFQKRFRVVYEVTNLTGGPVQYIAGTAADLYIANDDRGTGIFIDGPNRFVGGSNVASLKAGGLQEATSSQLPGEATAVAVPRWASYGEGGYSAITSRLLGADAFDNLINPSQIDNGVGASWDDRATTGLPAGATTRYEVSWHAERAVPLTASPAQTSRELPGRHDVVLSLIDGQFSPVPGAPIRYRVNGANPSPADPSQYLRAVTNDAGQVIVSIDGTVPGEDTVLAFADVLGAENGVRENAEPEASARIRWLADNRVGGAPDVPSSLTGPNGSVAVGTVANPDNAEAPTFTFGRSATAGAGFPDCVFDGRSGRQLNFPVGVDLQPGSGTIGGAELLIVDRSQHDPNATGGSTEPPSLPASSVVGNRYVFTVGCVTVSDLWVRFTITEGGGTQTFVIPIGGLLLIDPQGVVHDRAGYDAAIAAGRTPDEARAASAITGATVRLQRRNSLGAFADVFSGDPAIRPNVNPQVTRGDGLFQWDVAEGTYRVRVTAPGFTDVVSRAVDVPPPVLDLHVAMDRSGVTPRPQPVGSGPVAAPPVVTVRAPVTSFLKALLPKSRTTKVKVSRTGVVRIGSVSCARTAALCAKTAIALRPVSRGKGRGKLPAILATRKLSPKPGKTVGIVLTLDKKTRALVRARRSVPVVLTMSGTKQSTITRRFVLVRG